MRPLAEILEDALVAGAVEFQITDEEAAAVAHWMDRVHPAWTDDE